VKNHSTTSNWAGMRVCYRLFVSMVLRLDCRGAVEAVGKGGGTVGAFLTAFLLTALGFTFLVAMPFN